MFTSVVHWGSAKRVLLRSQKSATEVGLHASTKRNCFPQITWSLDRLPVRVTELLACAQKPFQGINIECLTYLGEVD